MRAIRCLPPLLLLFASPVLSQGTYLWDQSDVDLGNWHNISTEVYANDFSVLRSQRIESVDLFLGDNDGVDNGVFAAFSGTIGWAIYDNGASGHPGSLVASGSDSAPAVTDTGLNWGSGNSEVFRVRFALDPPVTLASGSWWLAIHEGAWLSPADGSSILWIGAVGQSGMPREVSTITPATWTPEAADNAFAVYGSEVLQSQEWACCLTHDISQKVWADEFVLFATTRPAAAKVWLLDGQADDDGTLGSFSGTLGWAIYDDGSDEPGSLLASGQDSTPILLDTGFNSGSNDLVRVTIDLAGAPELTAGTYWLALHEGNWGEASDNSSVHWFGSSTTNGSTLLGDNSVGSPSSWDQVGFSDGAFVLFDDGDAAADLVFASGFEAGVACTWTAITGGSLCP